MHTPTATPAHLRQVLQLDSAASAGMGLLLAACAGPLSPVFGLPAGLLRWAGIGLVPFAAALAVLARRKRHAPGAVRLVVLCNAAWVGASVLLLPSGLFRPTAVGTGFVLAQAAAVALFAWLEGASLRRAPAGWAA